MQSEKKLRYIMYCRKSTDSEDRQIQSIEDQREHLQNIQKNKGLLVIKYFEESMSAKRAGRPLFNNVLKMIQAGEAEGIICWKLNRLARNPIDGGQIQWMLQEGTIKSIITSSKEYLPSDNILMMAVEFGMANQFVLDLSKDVKRGMEKKLRKGWLPHRAPLGYINDKFGDKGNKKIFKHPEKFDLIKKCWELFLTGAYSVPRLEQIAHERFGLCGHTGKRLNISSWYTIFKNPFYFGEFVYKGEWLKGAHDPMITENQYDQAQKILGKAGAPRPKSKRLPLTGIIQCKECGGMITAEEKFKKLKSGTIQKYLYHHCAKRKKGIKCHQQSIKHEDLIRQIHGYLDSITIPQEFLHWAINVLRENNQAEEMQRGQIIDNQRRNYDNCLKRIDNLINLYISPENSNRAMLSEQEFKDQKNGLVREKERIETELRRVEGQVDEWIALTEETFNFATYAKYWFDNGDYEKKKEILMALGQNFYLEDGLLSIELQKPYLILRDGFAKSAGLDKARLEPAKLSLIDEKNSRFATTFSQWSG